jgi:elongation factor G
MVRVDSLLSNSTNSSRPVIAELCDGSGRTHTLNLSSTAAVQLCVMLSHYAPAKLALMEPIKPARFRVDDFVPIIELVIEAKDAGGRAAVVSAVAALVAEGVQIRFEDNAASSAVKLAGIDERQLDQVVTSLRAIVPEITFGAPQVAYREQIMERAEVDYSHKKVTDRGGEFARVKLVLEPILPRDGIAFMGVRARGVLNEDYIGAVERGVGSALAVGVLAGFPVTGVRALLVDGSSHETDSTPLAFEIAARSATKEALRQAQPALLEPIMRVEIVTSEEHVGAIIQDLKTRRGYTDGRGRRCADGIAVVANVPAANLLGYANSLRSMTGGRASYHAQFDTYAPVPQPDDPSFRPAVGMRAPG